MGVADSSQAIGAAAVARHRRHLCCRHRLFIVIDVALCVVGKVSSAKVQRITGLVDANNIHHWTFDANNR